MTLQSFRQRDRMPISILFAKEDELPVLIVCGLWFCSLYIHALFSTLVITTSLLIAPDAPVCQACRRDIGRVGSDPDFTPRWEKVKGKGENV